MGVLEAKRGAEGTSKEMSHAEKEEEASSAEDKEVQYALTRMAANDPKKVHNLWRVLWV